LLYSRKKSESGITAKEKFKAVLLTRWLSTHPGLDPESEGFSVKSVKLPGKGFQPCVLMRKAGAEEYEVEYTASLDTLIHEEHDDGSMRIRQGQEEAKFDGLTNAIGASLEAACHFPRIVFLKVSILGFQPLHFLSVSKTFVKISKCHSANVLYLCHLGFCQIANRLLVSLNAFQPMLCISANSVSVSSQHVC
jgi:hypothetical protein